MAVKDALEDCAEMATVAGIVTDALLLDKLTVTPPVGAAALKATVQMSVPDPAMEALAQVRELKVAVGLVAAAPVPLSPITSGPLPWALLETANCPVAAPGVAGAKLKFT